jgi:hypothetical protein
MLVDLAKHIANAYARDEGLEVAGTLARIRAGFDAEWNEATDTPSSGSA